ncbi:MAG: hypothetical protein AAGG44_06980 [Planctomycetota bacterium]
MDWDPEIDTPATVLVIGAGPVGIEAALYARFLGYEVHVAERARVGGGLAEWGDDPLHDSDAAMSNLGLAALQAQGAELPAVESVSSCSGYVQQYLIPVAKTDLLYQSIQINSELISLSRTGVDGITEISSEQKSELEFRALIHSKKRGEYSQVFDLVLDCSGVTTRAGLASGRGFAKGESSLPTEIREAAESGLFHGRTAISPEWMSGTTIVYGAGVEACATLQEYVSKLADGASSRLIWLLPKSYELENSPNNSGEQSKWASELLELPKQYMDEAPRGVAVMDCWGIESIRRPRQAVESTDEHPAAAVSPWEVTMQTRPEESLELTCERFINCQTPLTDWSFYHRLQVGEAAKQRTATGDLDSATPTLTSEPHLYVLGSKTIAGSGDKSELDWQEIREQIRSTFALVGGRQDLNLYESVRLQA